jgi:beta,beta-carotene 9',10'-dioxygenase
MSAETTVETHLRVAPSREDASPSASAGRGALAVRPRDLSDRAPFRGRPDHQAILETTLRGEIPAWLRGDLVRTAPAVFAEGAWEAHHWFDALGTLYAFRIGDTGVTYRQRLMETDVAKAAHEGRTPRASFGSPIVRGFWRRIFQPVPEVTDNANVNIVALGDERVALTESPHQWAIDRDTLAVTKKVAYTDGHGSLAMLAHPHFDFESGRVVSVGTKIGPRSEIVVYEHAPNARERTIVGRVRTARMPYVHAFGLTPKHAILIGHPFDVRPHRMLWSNRGFIDHFEHRPEAGTTLWLVDRASGAVREHAAPSGFVFHVVNAFEENGETSIDVCLYPDPSVVANLGTEAIRTSGFPGLVPSITRWTMREGVREARVEVLLAEGFEFPAISYRKKNGQRHGVSWGARIGPNATRSELVRMDGASERVFVEEGFVFGEPVFVARPSSTDEDDGVIVSVGSHRTLDRSAMVVLDARTMEVVARVEVPLPIPLGFHGSFFR